MLITPFVHFHSEVIRKWVRVAEAKTVLVGQFAVYRHVRSVGGGDEEAGGSLKHTRWKARGGSVM